MSDPRASLAALLGLACLASACLPTGTPGGAAGGSPKPRVGTSVAASARPTASPASVATATPIAATPAAPAPAVKLRKPATGSVALAGRVALEAAYALGQGATLLSNNGAGVIANNGAGVIANNGGNVVSNNGGAVVAMNGARFEGAGGRIVSNNGGGVLADGPGNVIARAAGGVATQLGDGTLLAGAAPGAGYRVAQAAAKPAAGTEAAAAGMLVSVVALRDHRYLSLGEDDRGQPVYAVYSNAEGAFEVHLPADAQGTLMVVASAPGTTDRRLAHNVVAVGAAGPLAVDELGRLVSDYLRRGFSGRLAEMLQHPDVAAAYFTLETFLTPAGKAAVQELITQVSGTARAGGLPPEADPARIQAKARLFVDAILARMDLKALKITRDDFVLWEGEPYGVLDAYRRAMQVLLDGAAGRLRTDPDTFSQAFLEGVINAPVNGVASPPIGDWRGAIRKPADVGDFLLTEYLSASRANTTAPVRRLYREFRRPGSGRIEDVGNNLAADADFNDLFGACYQTMVAAGRLLATDAALRAELQAIAAAP